MQSIHIIEEKKNKTKFQEDREKIVILLDEAPMQLVRIFPSKYDNTTQY